MIEWANDFLSVQIYSHIVAFFLGFWTNYITGLYFHKRGIKKRGLTYRVNEVRTQIVKAGEASRLSVLHDNQEMKGDVMAVHIDIWNQGHESIRPTNILRPLVIETENHVPVLEANIRKANRDVIGLRLDESKCAQGQLGISWDILEKDDYGVVQLIYAGPPDLNITAHAILEGQREIINGSPLTSLPFRPRFKTYLILSTFFCGLGATLIDFYYSHWGINETDSIRSTVFFIILHVLLFWTIISVIILRRKSRELKGLKPPFKL